MYKKDLETFFFMRNLIRFLAIENLQKTIVLTILYFVMIVISARTTIIVHTPHKTTFKKKKNTLVNASYLKHTID
jgi:hypothetical protein